VRLGNEVHRQLVMASRKARPAWNKLFARCESVMPIIKQLICAGRHSIHIPEVSAFMVEWARNLGWPLCPSGCWDAIGVSVPHHISDALSKSGGIESFQFILGDAASQCCATLGSNDHNLRFGLIVNCPIWMEIAARPEFQHSFEKQLGFVIHHEMAHFRWKNDSPRSETHAHIRALGWLLSRGVGLTQLTAEF
jgi:hypothetical protein